MNELESVLKRLERLEKQNRRLKLVGITSLLFCAGVLLMGQGGQGLQDGNFRVITAEQITVAEIRLGRGNDTPTTIFPTQINLGRCVIDQNSITFLDSPGGEAIASYGSTMLAIHQQGHETQISGNEITVGNNGGNKVTLNASGAPRLTMDFPDSRMLQLDPTGLQITAANWQPALSLTNDALTLADGNIRLSKSNGASLKLIDPDGRRSAVELSAGETSGMQFYGGSRLSLGASLQGGVGPHQITLDAGLQGGDASITVNNNGQVSGHVP